MRMKGKKPIFNRRDTYNLDATLDPIITEGLKKFREVMLEPDNVMASYPTNMDGYEYGNNIPEQEKTYMKQWIEIVDKMIFAFEFPDDPDIPTNIEIKLTEIGKPHEDGSQEMSVKVNDEDAYNEYKRNCDTHQKKVEEGHALFIKHYKNLWW